MTPVYFGTALNNLGVDERRKGLGNFAPPPRPQPAEGRMVLPTEKPVTGFVFKVQANMDKNHRDRVAFLRLCSGHFKRGLKMQPLRSGQPITVRNPPHLGRASVGESEYQTVENQVGARS